MAVAVRAGEGGRLFGSVTNQEIADALKEQHGIDIDRRKIVLENTIKQTGPAQCEIKLFAEVSANLKLNIVERK